MYQRESLCAVMRRPRQPVGGSEVRGRQGDRPHWSAGDTGGFRHPEGAFVEMQVCSDEMREVDGEQKLEGVV